MELHPSYHSKLGVVLYRQSGGGGEAEGSQRQVNHCYLSRSSLR